MSTAKARAPKPRKVTGVTIRRVREQFRAFVIALPPGATLEWFDMDLWVFVNFPEYNRDDGDYEDDRDPNVECMVVAQEMESQGWLAYRLPARGATATITIAQITALSRMSS